MKVEGPWNIGITAIVKARFIYKDLDIDTSLNFIVDTGNAATLIGYQSAAVLKIDYFALSKEGTANGIPCKVTGPCKVEFSNDVKFDLPGMRILENKPGHYPDNLLGLDVLRFFRIGFTDKKIVLEFNPKFPEEPF